MIDLFYVVALANSFLRLINNYLIIYLLFTGNYKSLVQEVCDTAAASASI